MNIIHHEKINETLYKKKLSNGLDLVIIPRNNYYKTEINLAVNFGSIHQSLKKSNSTTTHNIPAGTAHFLEHMIFENNSQPWQDILLSPEIFINASTSLKRTSFTLSTVEDIYPLIPVLLDTVQNPSFFNIDLDKEKTIISHEIQMYDNNPEWLSRIKLLNNMYTNPVYTTDILGDEYSIQKIDSHLLKRCHEHYYHPNNMILTISGPVNPYDIIHLIENHQSNKTFNEQKFYKYDTLEDSQPILKKLDMIKKGNEHKTFIGFKLQKPPTMNLIKFKLSIEIYIYFLSKEINSIMSDQVFEFNFESNISKEFNNVILFANTSKYEYVDQLLITAHNNLNKQKFDKNQFFHVIQKKSGEILSILNSTNFLLKNYINHYFEDMNFLNFLNVIENIQLTDLHSIHNVILKQQNKSIVVQTPE